MRIIFQKLLKKPALTFEIRNDILGKYFGNALSSGLRREPQSENRTDERHRGSQLKVPKETGIFSRKIGPAVLFIFEKRCKTGGAAGSCLEIE